MHDDVQFQKEGLLHCKNSVNSISCVVYNVPVMVMAMVAAVVVLVVYDWNRKIVCSINGKLELSFRISLLLPLIFLLLFLFYNCRLSDRKLGHQHSTQQHTHTPQIPTVTATIFAIQLSFFLAFNIHFLKHDAQPLPTVVKYICDANLLLYIETVCGFQLTSSTTIICSIQTSLLYGLREAAAL